MPAHSPKALTLHCQITKFRITDAKLHPTHERTKKIVKRKRKERVTIMKRMIKKIATSRKFNNYCDNMLKMYSYGRINMPA